MNLSDEAVDRRKKELRVLCEKVLSKLDRTQSQYFRQRYSGIVANLDAYNNLVAPEKKLKRQVDVADRMGTTLSRGFFLGLCVVLLLLFFNIDISFDKYLLWLFLMGGGLGAGYFSLQATLLSSQLLHIALEKRRYETAMKLSGDLGPDTWGKDVAGDSWDRETVLLSIKYFLLVGLYDEQTAIDQTEG